MDERAALDAIAGWLPAAGDDAAVIDDCVLTTDMLHASTDFPSGVTTYTAGWRAVGASLSDIAAMGAPARAAVAVYAAPAFDSEELEAFVTGARDVCGLVDAEYVGGDLDAHKEFTVATTALGQTADPVLRTGATPGEAVCITGTLGRSAAGLRLFEVGEHDRANDLFRFEPRVRAGVDLAPHAGAMMDVSDGLARSLHQLSAASDCGFEITSPLPIDERVRELATDDAEERELGAFFGEDFELVATVPEAALEAIATAAPVPLTRIGTVTEAERVRLDGESLPDRGYAHG